MSDPVAGSSAPTILLCAVEPSADAMGASLLGELRRRLPPGARFVGCGGLAMSAAGFESDFDTSSLAVMGVGSALRAVPSALIKARLLARRAAETKADAAVLIDAWGFSRLVAARMKTTAPGTRLVKLAAPQVWASRPGRTAFVAAHFDLVLTLFPFEPPLFEKAGARALFVGNPNFEAVANAPRSGPAFRARHGLGGSPLLVILPGSRRGEVTRLIDTFGDTAQAARHQVRGLKSVIVAAPSVEEDVRRAAAAWPSAPLVVGAEERLDAFDAADAALAASGTVTTELAMCGVPMVVAYRVGGLTAAWAKRVMIAPAVSVLNVAAGEKIIPERLQHECTVEQLTADVVRLFTDDETRRRQLSAFRRLLPELLGKGGAAMNAADAIIRLVEREDPGHLDARPEGK